MSLVPHRFLLRLTHPCRFKADMPSEGDRLLDLDDSFDIENYAALDAVKNFAKVRLAWNHEGLGFQVDVRGKDKAPQADPARPRGSDGLTVWLDTRDSRASHRASRYCHQFHLLPTGGGADKEGPVFVQSRINRALEDAPVSSGAGVSIKTTFHKAGYLLEAFLPSAILNGYDPDQHQRLGFFYSVRDEELGEQLLNITSEFPFWEDPSLWSVLELAPA